uniref:Uncharacterized protein n=1 Tax=Arundo donax TaxID=35708 RepID=A0A0A9G3Q1_ARUDO
MATLQHLLLPI